MLIQGNMCLCTKKDTFWQRKFQHKIISSNKNKTAQFIPNMFKIDN